MTLEANAAILTARLRELRARHHAERHTDRVRGQMVADEIASVESALACSQSGRCSE